MKAAMKLTNESRILAPYTLSSGKSGTDHDIEAARKGMTLIPVRGLLLAGSGQRKSGAQNGFYNHSIIDYKSL
jgi:hypothetical protein